MGRDITIEVCLDSIESLRVVKRVSAEFNEKVNWRIELCSNLLEGGGLTPSIGLVLKCMDMLDNRKLMVMIRPRTGSFIYSEDELSTMEADIAFLSKCRVDGFVYGCLRRNGDVDFEAAERFEAAAEGKQLTFHRAFDLTAIPLGAFEDFCDEGLVSRVLTSGQAQNVTEGADMIQELIALQKHDVTILPGSGINAEMLPAFLQRFPDLKEIHLSASEIVEDKIAVRAVRRGAELGFGSGKRWKMNEDKLRAVFQVIYDLQQ